LGIICLEGLFFWWAFCNALKRNNINGKHSGVRVKDLKDKEPGITAHGAIPGFEGALHAKMSVFEHALSVCNLLK
jgi:hypothetical protein